MEILDGIEMALAAYHDSVSAEVRNNIRREYEELLKVDAQARRHKARSMILTMHSRKLALEKLEKTYSLVKSSGCVIPELEQFIRDHKKEIHLLSLQKNHGK